MRKAQKQDEDAEVEAEVEAEVRRAHEELDRHGEVGAGALFARIRRALLARSLVEESLREAVAAAAAAKRRRLPTDRCSITHKFSVGGHEGYVVAGMYEDGSLGEIFIHMAKEGSTISGLMDSFALVFSIAIQHGVPLDLLLSKMVGLRFDPFGWTRFAAIPEATSLMDYLARWLALRFGVDLDEILAREGKGTR